MKKLFFAIAAMAAMLTSCSKDETTPAPVPQRSMVTFNVNAPELATRAEGDGTTATNLQWVIYDLAEEVTDANIITGSKEFNLTTSVEVSLVEGREYEAIFFASAPDSPYTFNKTTQTMTINTSGLTANNEAYDAFYKYVEPFEIETSEYNVEVKMKRPFAQLNVATNDMQKEAGKLIDAATTGVKVEAYNTLDLKSGAVSGKSEITFALDDKMSQHIVAGGESYDWLSMNYILVNTRETVDVEFSFTDEKADGTTEVYTREYSAVPVQRNYRTNIVGSILTSPTNFNVTIVPGFVEPNIDWNVDGVTEVTIERGDLQTALNSLGTGEYSEPGTYIFNLDEMMAGVTRSGSTPSYIVKQQEGYNIIIDGCGLKFDGQFKIYGNSRNNGAETLLFRNINFVHTDGKFDFIWSDDGGDNEKRYPHNVTVENCTFTGNADGGAVVGMRLRQVYNANIVNCVSGEGMFSLAQITSSQAALSFDNVTITNNTEGINLLSSLAQVTIKNSNISAVEYGVRADGTCTDATIAIENAKINALYPVVVRKMTGKLGVELNGQNTLEAGQQYDVVFTNGAYKSLEEPTGEWSITGAEGYNVYPGGVMIYTIEGLKAFRNAVNAGDTYAGKTVTLMSDIDLDGQPWSPIGSDKANCFKGTFDGNNHTVSNLYINDLDLIYAGLFGYANGATIKNVKVHNVNISAYSNVGSIAGIVYTGKVENCHVSGAIKLYADYAYAAGITSDGYVTVKNCSVIATNTGVITVKDKTGAGGITGWRGEGKNDIINCTVMNLDITAWASLGAISGIVQYDNTISGCVAENIKLTKTREDGQASIGLAAGNWSNKSDNNYKITITNNSFKNISLNGSALKSKDGVDLSSFLQDGQRLIGTNYSAYINIPEDNLEVRDNSYENISDNLTFIEK